MNRNYYVVYTKLMQDPDAIFINESWARRFIREQEKIWVNAKFCIEEVDGLTIREKIIEPKKWWQFWRLN